MDSSASTPIIRLAVDLTPEQVGLLSTMKTENFTPDQPDRFAVRAGSAGDIESFSLSATLLWCESTLDAFIVLAAERAAGYDALHLWDQAGDGTSQQEVVLTSRPWPLAHT